MPDEVLQAMHHPALNIYSREMVGCTADTPYSSPISASCSPPRANLLHLYRQRPRRLGSNAEQRADAATQPDDKDPRHVNINNLRRM